MQCAVYGTRILPTIAPGLNFFKFYRTTENTIAWKLYISVAAGSQALTSSCQSNLQILQINGDWIPYGRNTDCGCQRFKKCEKTVESSRF